MKFFKFSFLISVLIIFTLQSCNNDEITNEPSISPQRIKKISYYDEFENLDSQGIYTYDGAKLINLIESRINNDGEWQDFFIMDIEYNNNIILTNSKVYTSQSNTWTLYKAEYIIDNGLNTEITSRKFVNNEWIGSYKYIYQYSDLNLTYFKKWLDFDEDGIFSEDTEGHYIYENNILKNVQINIKNNDVWSPSINYLFSYSENRIDGWIHQIYDSNNWIDYIKMEYTYSGNNNITDVTKYYWSASNWVISNFNRRYTYNSNGNMVESYLNEKLRITIEYEEGNGNSDFFYIRPHEKIFRPKRY